MALREELEAQGSWLFKWRSYLPFLISPVLFIALRSSGSLEKIIGHIATDIYDIACIIISLVGLCIRCITIGYVLDGTSGRNTKGQRAETLNTTGMYSIVRHPLYLGNFFISIGLALFIQVWWFVIIIALVFWLYYERIMFVEEEFLRRKFGTLYLRWAEKTPAFIPSLRLWQHPYISFSFGYALMREYPTLFGIITSYILLYVVESAFTKGGFRLEPLWIILFLANFSIFLTLRILKKRTSLLCARRGA